MGRASRIAREGFPGPVTQDRGNGRQTVRSSPAVALATAAPVLLGILAVPRQSPAGLDALR